MTLLQNITLCSVKQCPAEWTNTVVPGFSVLGFRALCTGNQIWIYVINLPGFSALPGFKAPFHGDGQSALNPGTTVFICDGLNAKVAPTEI